MNDPRDLRLYIVPPGHGAAFRAERAAGLAFLRPLTQEASDWLADHVHSEATWNDGRLVIELRYFPPIVDGIVDAGFLFEGDAGLEGTIQ
jgi:hypothetical protein